ncbi:pre-toxin TG domain-containing protein [Parageobacillus toebii]|uniref:pre-toxin TG domain-containing protein n=1 Tax=Parageobacillus toebii TaxID=153151 RepID=UPI0019674099|nr:pre-toxin TG domain-containing protein [Parageobacillus toebii]QSB49574.1 pre-toxin TG domain-containing protein [Parageobacillus toebii]WMT19686.1 pre-toxin TG domain-containing protein [Parageobacillus toebii]
MTTIRVNPEELEAVAERVPDAEDGCSRARTSLSWEFPSLVMKIPGISTDAIDRLRDELIHWLDCYEEKLNEAEELLYRTAAAIRQADQTLADNMKEFGLELLGWYDLQRLFGEYDPVTGERISGWDRLFAGGMLLLSVIPPAKEAGVAGKAAIKGAKAAETAVDVSKLVSQTKNVLNYNKIKPFFQTIYHQVIKGPITETIRSFKKQWENFRENVGSVLHGPQLAADGVEVVPSGQVIGIAEESASSVRFSMSQVGGEVGKGTEDAAYKGAVNLNSVPSVKNGEFNRWFNSLTPDEFDKIWSDPRLRKAIESRLRHPGGFHEWHLVSRAPTFKRWGVTAEQIKELRTAIEDVKFVNPKGVHGGKGSTRAHNELLEIIDSSPDYATFKRRLQNWASYRLEGGVESLPEGLRP